MLALALGGFGIGTTEFVSMGLLSYIADDFGISEAQAGHVVTAYAMGVVVGAPLITTLTGRIPRRRLIIILMAAFTLGNALSMFAHSYGMLMLARFIAGFPHGAFFAVANLIAASMAEPGKRGQAIARISLGLATATVIGVPAAQWVGSVLGWSVAYGVVALIGLLCLAGLWMSMPHMTLMPVTRPSTEAGALVNPQVWLTLAAGAIGFGGMFCVYTYITWTMTERAGYPEGMMWFVLMVYGIGMVIGNTIGGRLADWNIPRSIVGAFLMMAVMLVAFYAVSTIAPPGDPPVRPGLCRRRHPRHCHADPVHGRRGESPEPRRGDEPVRVQYRQRLWRGDWWCGHQRRLLLLRSGAGGGGAGADGSDDLHPRPSAVPEAAGHPLVWGP